MIFTGFFIFNHEGPHLQILQLNGKNIPPNNLVIKGKAYIGISKPTMRCIAIILLCSLSIAASASPIGPLQTDSSKNVITDYPQILQKAGVKKVRCIFKDSRKFIWIGTENGLYRYDGTNVDILQHDAGNPHSLPHNTVVSIAEDRSGNIWTGTLEGAAKIDPVTLVCQVYYTRRHNLDQEYDIKIHIDDDGEIWAYGSKGLDYLDISKNRFIKAWECNVNDKSGVGYVNCLTEWKKDTLAIGTFDGAVLINKNTFGFRRLLPGKRIAIIRAFTDRFNNLWLGSWGLGCTVFSSDGKKLVPVKVEREKPGELTNVITGIISTNYDHNYLVWISTLKGVYKISGEIDGLSSARMSTTMASPGYAANIMADDEQYIWEAGNTVSRFFAGDNFFKPVPVDYAGTVQDIYPLTLNGKRSIAYLTWYASSGLVITDPTGKDILYRQPSQNSQDMANVGGIAQDKYNRMWVSSLGGVQVFRPDFKPVYSFDQVTSGKDKLLGNKTNYLLIKNDTVWIVCYKRGIDLYDLNFHKLKSIKPGDGSGMMDDYVQRLFADSHGRMWICGNNKLYLYEPAKGKFKSFNFNRDSTSFAVNDMTELPGGDLLIASAMGLYRLNTQTFVYDKISSPLIDNNDILTVSVDNNGDIWFINDEHLVYYQVKAHHFTLFGREDGLNAANDLQWLRMIDHKYFFLAADKQIVSFSPGGLAGRSHPVKLYFHDVSVNDSTLARSAFTGPLKLKYNENRLNIGFGAINYIKPEQNLYAYQLSSIDDHWVYTAHNFVSYANLPPGSYKFKLKAANYAGLWSPPISMTIVVSPPFWATWLFRLLSFLLIGSLLLIAIRYVLQRNLREKILKLEKEQAVEKERNRIARDMHDDLGSGLTKIAILSEVAKTQMSSPVHASANLDVISNASRELVDNLQDIIWVLNPRNDSLNSLVLYIKEYTESFFEPARIQYEFLHQGTNIRITLSEEQRRNIFLAVKESCNNILKHAECSQACVSVKLANGLLTIIIKDNGRGFDTREVGAFSNGLQNIRNRTDQIGASCQINSAKNAGTEVTLTIPM